MTMVIDGTNGITFPDSSTETSTSIGYSPQAWTNVLASRAKNTTYTNSTGRPICVSISIDNNAATGNGPSTLVVNGVTVQQISDDSSAYGQSNFFTIVPAGGTYQLTDATVHSIPYWAELR